VYELAGGVFASAVHHGEFAGFAQMHGALLGWIESNGYRITGPSREIYLQLDHSHLSDTVTEVQYPIEKG
jgi:effector-binding domain-containing protein